MRDSSESRSSSLKSTSSSSSIDGGEDEEGPPPTKTPASSPFTYAAYDGDEDDDIDEEDQDDEDYDDSNLLEIMIETLTGTSFQVRVSPWETAGGLKDLLHRTQGIPSCHQHILLGQRELLDESPLIDQGVQDGSSLKLILSMKGGPINSIRVPTQEDAIWKEFNTYMEMNRDELWEGTSGRQVTLLVLREGDDVNIYRVVENADGSFSPLNESWGSNSLVSGKTDSSSDKESKLQDEVKMHKRISDLRRQMDALQLKKQEKKKRKKVIVGKISPRTNKHFPTKIHRIKQSTPNHKRKNMERHFNELEEEAAIPQEFFKPDESHMHADIGASKVVPPLRRLPSLPSLNLSSRPSSQQYSHRSDQTSRPPSQILHYPSTPLDSARLNLTRRNSRPSTQEKGSEIRKSSVSKGVVLDDLPHSLPPIQVDFSRRKRLESIRAQRERSNPLGPLTEDSINNSASNVVHPESYRKSLVKHSKAIDSNFSSDDENSIQEESWSRSGVPIPLYMDPPRTRRRHQNRRLYQSFNNDFLKFPAEFDDRPKTSPEILAAKRPGTGSTNSTMSDRIQLRGPDEKLKELINILNNSRTSSRGSRHSIETSTNSSSNKWQACINQNGFRTPPDKISLSMSLTSFQGSPPSNPSTPGIGSSYPSDAGRKEALRELVRSQGVGVRPSSRKSTPDTFRKGGRRLPSSRNSTPNKFPPLTPKKKPKRLQRPHCRQCHRKLGISSTYSCRCGHVFCASHRYSEAHDCTFDYKAQGRKFLQMTNPLVVPPKLPKI